MSLVLAIKSSTSPILASDTRMISTLDGMNYQVDKIPKIVEFGRNTVAGITGQVELMSEFLGELRRKKVQFETNASLSSDADAVAAGLRSLYLERFGMSPLGDDKLSFTTITFAGQTSEGLSFIYDVHANSNFRVLPREQFAVCGQEAHGGIYYLSRFYHREIKAEDAAFLAYFCIREVASRDGAVGVPVQVWKVENGTASQIEQSLYEGFARRHQLAHREMSSWFLRS